MHFTKLAFILTVFSHLAFAQDSIVIYAKQINFDDEHQRSRETIEEYASSENWRIWSIPFEKLRSTTSAENSGNLGDKEISTAWSVNVDSSNSVRNVIQVEMFFHRELFYGSAYQFCGEVNVFNGLCSSISDWENASRVKTLNVSFKGKYLCSIELVDTWHFQTFDISRFFKNGFLGTNMDGIVVENGDVLEFEIVDIYAGFSSRKAYLSEFLMEGAKN